MHIDITDEDGKPIDEIATDWLVAFAPATHLLYEWRTYWVECPGATVLRIGDRQHRPVRGHLFRVRFENQLGLTTIRPYTDRTPLAPPLIVEVLSQKFQHPDRHRGFFETLLRDLFVRAARLPFIFSAPTSRTVSESLQPPTALFVFHFLCQYGGVLRAAIATIQAAPHRVLTDHPTYVPIGEASEVGPDVLLGILQTPNDWVPASQLPLARRLRGLAPARVWQRQPEETFDTPENRFVRAFLQALLAAAETIPVQPWWQQVPEDRQRTVRGVAAVVRQAITHPMFDEVGALHQIPASLQVLLRHDGYRELRELWQIFHHARRPLFAPLQHAIEVRQIDKLYEYWGFFAVTEAIAAALGTPPVMEIALSDASGLHQSAMARFGAAGTLVYNQHQPSYSVRLRPDYTWKRGREPLIALDAKFRLDRPPRTDDADESSTVKEADIHKMHTYRDALGVRAAVVIYPGTESLFFDRTRGELQIQHLRDVLLGNLNGVGALAMHPAHPLWSN